MGQKEIKYGIRHFQLQRPNSKMQGVEVEGHFPFDFLRKNKEILIIISGN